MIHTCGENLIDGRSKLPTNNRVLNINNFNPTQTHADTWNF